MKKLSFLFAFMAAIALTSCKGSAEPASATDDETTVEENLPKGDGKASKIGVSTLKVDDPTTTDVFTIKIAVDRSVSASEHGVAYSTNLADFKQRTAWRMKCATVGTSEGTVELYPLYSGAKYYYAAYSIISGSCYYGETMSFTTPDVDPCKSVDLGLSVLWGDRNLGAASDTEVGNFYYWAETYPAGATSPLYNDIYYGKWLDMSSIAGTDYDVVHKKMGDRWRMPTRAEMEELRDNCDWNVVQVGGKYLFKVSPKADIYKSSHFIYIPVSGYLVNGPTIYNSETEPTMADPTYACLFTATQCDIETIPEMFGGGKDLRHVYALEFDYEDHESMGGDYSSPSVGYMTNEKYFGYPVRPVYEPLVIN